MNLEHNGYSSTYILPVLCASTLLLVLGVCINPIAHENGKIHAAITENFGSGSTISLSIINNNVEVVEDGTVSTNVEAGQISYISNLIKIATNRIGKYYIGVQAANGSNSELTGKDYGATITGVGSNVGVRNFGDNTWGYVLTDQASVDDANLTYSTLPAYNAGASPQYQSMQNPSDGEHVLKLTFAAKIRADKPADHYRTQALVSVAAEAKAVTLAEITYMQDINSDVCYYTNQADAAGNYQYQLVDKRDSKTYWVAKLKDGNCWMTQNLALDLKTTETLTSTLSDVSSWAPSVSTQQGAISYINSNTSNYSYSPGEYFYTTPIEGNYCTDSSSITNCPNWTLASGLSKNTNKDIRAHYLTGNYYAWPAATAGTLTGLTSSNASGSICPKGWTVPSIGQYQSLVNGLTSSATVTSNNIKLAPYYFVFNGGVAGTKFDAIGLTGQYWSSTASSTPYVNDGMGARHLFFNSNEFTLNVDALRSEGNAIRCVAR